MNPSEKKEIMSSTLEVDRLIIAVKDAMKKNAGESLRLSKEAINLALLSGYSKGLAEAYLNAGIACRLTSNFEAAVEYYDEALKLNRKHDDKKAESRTLNSIANVYLSLSDYKKAIEFYDESIFVLQSLGDLAFEAIVITNRGLAYQQYGDMKAALNNYLESMSIYKSISAPVHYALFNNLGIVYQEIGCYTESLKYFTEALKRTDKEKNEMDQSFALANIGRTYIYMEDFSNAVTYLSESIIFIKKFGNVQAESQVYSNLGKAFMKMRCFPEAIKYFNRALRYYKEISDTSSVSHTLCELGELYYILNDFKSCKSLFDESLKLSGIINDAVNEVRVYTGLAKLYLKFRQHDKAFKYLKDAETIAASRNSYKDLGKIYKVFSEIHGSSGNNIEANEALNKYYDCLKKMISIDEENKVQSMLMGHISDQTGYLDLLDKVLYNEPAAVKSTAFENIA